MSGHTPGPWRVCTLAHLEDRTVVVYGPTFSDPVATGIARAGIDASEAHANARLIAAAPELLAALRGMMACVEAEWGADFLPYNLSDDASAECNAAIMAARAALKAVDL